MSKKKGSTKAAVVDLMTASEAAPSVAGGSQSTDTMSDGAPNSIVKISGEMLDQLAEINRKVGITEHRNAKYDLGNLAVFVADDLDYDKLNNNSIDELARVNTQHLIARIFNLETVMVEEGRNAVLPDPRTHLPRTKPVPAQREPTKWEQFAALKGIKKRKRSKLVLDEESGEYKRRYGYKKANDIESKWVVEHKEGSDESVDPWTAARKDKKERVEKNRKQQMRNMLRAQPDSHRNLPGSIDLASAIGSKRLKRNAKKAGKEQKERSHLEIALATAQRATASMGKFDIKRKGEPALKAPRSSRRDGELQNPDVERKQHQSVMHKVLGRAKEKDSFSVDRAISSIGAAHVRHKELDTARAAQKIGRGVARELASKNKGKRGGASPSTSKQRGGKRGRK